MIPNQQYSRRYDSCSEGTTLKRANKRLSASPAVSGRRQRLAAVAAGGSTKQYLGGLTGAEKVDNLTEEEQRSYMPAKKHGLAP